METPIQKQDLAQTEDNIQRLRWIALGLWSVCSPVHRSRWISWAFDTRVNQPLIYCYILVPESVLHIPVDYYLSVHNSGKIYLQHFHWYYIHTYIHTHDIPFFWIGVYLWSCYLKFLLSILKLFVLAGIKGDRKWFFVSVFSISLWSLYQNKTENGIPYWKILNMFVIFRKLKHSYPLVWHSFIFICDTIHHTKYKRKYTLR
jgi:hypothetical protein